MSNLTLFAMSEKGLVVLKALADRFPGLISLVVTAKDSAVLEDHFEALKTFCASHNIACRERSEITEVTTPYSLAVSWRWMIPTTGSRIIVFHDSLLPKYRGFNPLVTALLQGDRRVGVTALFASEEYDRGEIIAQKEISVSYPIKIRDAITQILECYVILAEEIGRKLLSGEKIASYVQDEALASYSLWRDEEDYLVDWEQSAETIKRFVDSVGFPYQGASTFIWDQKVRIMSSTVVDDVPIANRSFGKVIFVNDSKPVVVCGTGLLRIEELVFDETRESALPLAKFRTRFRNFKR